MVRKRDNGRWEGRIVVSHKENGLSSATVHGIHTTLHHALKAARDQELIPVNPADEVEPSKVIHQPMKILNEEQLSTLIDVIQKDTI